MARVSQRLLQELAEQESALQRGASPPALVNGPCTFTGRSSSSHDAAHSLPGTAPGGMCGTLEGGHSVPPPLQTPHSFPTAAPLPGRDAVDFESDDGSWQLSSLTLSPLRYVWEREGGDGVAGGWGERGREGLGERGDGGGLKLL